MFIGNTLPIALSRPAEQICIATVHFGYSGHLGPPLSGHYIRLATISDLNIIE